MDKMKLMDLTSRMYGATQDMYSNEEKLYIPRDMQIWMERHDEKYNVVILPINDMDAAEHAIDGAGCFEDVIPVQIGDRMLITMYLMEQDKLVDFGVALVNGTGSQFVCENVPLDATVHGVPVWIEGLVFCALLRSSFDANEVRNGNTENLQFCPAFEAALKYIQTAPDEMLHGYF